jgi:hypothetical protein
MRQALLGVTLLRSQKHLVFHVSCSHLDEGDISSDGCFKLERGDPVLSPTLYKLFLWHFSSVFCAFLILDYLGGCVIGRILEHVLWVP